MLLCSLDQEVAVSMCLNGKTQKVTVLHFRVQEMTTRSRVADHASDDGGPSNTHRVEAHNVERIVVSRD